MTPGRQILVFLRGVGGGGEKRAPLHSGGKGVEGPFTMRERGLGPGLGAERGQERGIRNRKGAGNGAGGLTLASGLLRVFLF